MRVVSDVGPLVRAVAVGPVTEIGGLSRLVAELNGEFEVVGPTWPPTAALTQVLHHRPQALLVDCDHDLSGALDLVRIVRNRFSSIKVIVFGSSTSADHVREAFRAGASAYLSATCTAAEFTSALWALEGELILWCSDAAASLFGTEVRIPLRRVELQALRLLADGCTYDEISEQLELSRSTLKRHLNQIENKLNARNRLQAVARATKQGLI
jgi:two-component system response regulator DesR